MPYKNIFDSIPKITALAYSMIASILVSDWFLGFQGIMVQVKDSLAIGPLPSEFFVPIVYIYGTLACTLYSLFMVGWEIKSRAENSPGHVNMNAWGFALLFFLPPVAGMASWVIYALYKAGLHSMFELVPGPGSEVIIGIVSGYLCVNYLDPANMTKIWSNVKSKIWFLK